MVGQNLSESNRVVCLKEGWTEGQQNRTNESEGPDGLAVRSKAQLTQHKDAFLRQVYYCFHWCTSERPLNF